MLTAIPPSITAAGGRRADRQRRSAAAARIPVSPPSVHRPRGTANSRAITTTRSSASFCCTSSTRVFQRDERRAATARAGQLLAERGQISEALALFRDASEWDAMRSLIHAHALEWARQGRAQALSDWIEALPVAMRESDPWLDYWFGRAWIFVQPLRGRPPIERAYDGISRYRRRCAARRWRLPRSSRATTTSGRTSRRSTAGCPSSSVCSAASVRRISIRESELRARAAWLIALLLRKPDDENVARCAQRLDALIDGERRSQRARDGGLDAVQLHQLEDRRRGGACAGRTHRADSRASRK